MKQNNNIGHQIIWKNGELLEMTIHDAQEMIFWVTEDGSIVYANNSACDALIYTEDEFLELRYPQIDNFIDDNNWYSYWQNIKQKKSIRYETFHIKKNGQKFPVEVSVNYYKIVEKEFISIFCHDIHKRRQAERALIKSEEDFRLIAENSTDSIIHLNALGKIVYSTPSCVHIFGITPKEIYGKYFRDFISEEDFELFEHDLKKTFYGERFTNIEFKVIGGKQEQMIVGGSMVRFIKSNTAPKVQLIIRDITQPKKMEEDLEKALLDYENSLVETELLNLSLEKEISERKVIEKELVKAQQKAELANKAKSEFLANMSHEIRTPLNAVLGFAEILKDKLTAQPDLNTYIEGINAGGRSLLSLINDILDLSKIEAGRLEIQKEPVNLESLLKEVKQIFQKKIDDKGLSLNIEIAPEVPTALVIDQTRMRQILFNLVGNAIKFTTLGHVGMKIETKPLPGKKDQVDLILQVSDTGMGIPRKQQKLIFDPFKQQEGQSNRKYGGTGLGLSITKRLTEAMNGKISLESRLKKGSVFTLEFKQVEVAKQADIKENFGGFDSNNIKFEGSKILLVEDTLSNQKVFIGLLEPYDLKIFVANNGREALDKVDEIKPDMIFMDLRMPIMDGKEATKILRANYKYSSLPIIILSGSIFKDTETDHFNIFTDTLSKPVKRNDIINVLIKYLPHTIVKSPARAGNKTIPKSEPELKLPELEKTVWENLKGEVANKIVPLLTELEEYFDSEDAGKLAVILTEIGTKYDIPAYKTLANQLKTSIEKFELSKTDSILSTLKRLNSQI